LATVLRLVLIEGKILLASSILSLFSGKVFMALRVNLTELEIPTVLPPDDLLVGLGDSALQYAVHIDDLGLRDYQVLFLGSHGGKKEAIAEILDCEVPEVATARDKAIEAFEVHTFATAVHRAISVDYLPVEVTHDQATIDTLDWRDRILIEGFRQGYSNKDIAQASGMNKSEAYYYSPRLFNKIRATGRTHSVRRSHEIGLNIPSAIAQLYEGLTTSA
jgi:DNA-binding CsgD family transcriptional regulator